MDGPTPSVVTIPQGTVRSRVHCATERLQAPNPMRHDAKKGQYLTAKEGRESESEHYKKQTLRQKANTKTIRGMDTVDDNKLELLRRACVAHDVGIENRSYAALRAALGEKLVDIMLNVPFPMGASNSSTSSSSSSGSTDASARKKQTMWHTFLRTEKNKVREGMPELKGHDILKEVARRWKLHKLVNTDSSPLMLTPFLRGTLLTVSTDTPSDGVPMIQDVGRFKFRRNTKEDCAICFGQVTSRGWRCTTCLHVCHMVCINRWHQLNPLSRSCPSCRAQISSS